jgi:hypothetical protein
MHVAPGSLTDSRAFPSSDVAKRDRVRVEVFLIGTVTVSVQFWALAPMNATETRTAMRTATKLPTFIVGNVLEGWGSLCQWKICGLLCMSWRADEEIDASLASA